MINKNQTFEIIAFSADSKRYYPAYMERARYMDDSWVKHTDITIDLGQSRYGGPVLDLPPDYVPPDDLRFAAQLDLSKFAPFDKSGLLPTKGQLIFFVDIREERGTVLYADIPNSELVRHIVEHDDNFFTGVLVDQIWADTETLQSRYDINEDELEEQYEDEDAWSSFAGSNQSKIFGILTHCQLGEEEIIEQAFSNKTVLLQIGENGFNNEGVFSVLIDKDDLRNRRFDNCEFLWGQS